MLLTFAMLSTVLAVGIDTPSSPHAAALHVTKQSTASASASCSSATVATAAASQASGVSNKATIFFIVVNAISMAINAVIVSSHFKHKRRKKQLEDELRHKQQVAEEQKNYLKLEILCKRGELDEQGKFDHARHGCRDCGAEMYRSYGMYGDWNRRWTMPQPPPEVHERGGERDDRGRISDVSTLGLLGVAEHEGPLNFAETEKTKKSRSWKSKTVLRKKSVASGKHERWAGAPEVDV